MGTLNIVDTVANCLRSQIGTGVRRTTPSGIDDIILTEELARLVITGLALGGWVLMRREDLPHGARRWP